MQAANVGESRHLNVFDRTGNSVIRSTDPENPTVEASIWSGSDRPKQSYGHYNHEGCIWDRILREEEVVGGHPSSIVPSKRAMVLSYPRNRRDYNIYTFSVVEFNLDFPGDFSRDICLE